MMNDQDSRQACSAICHAADMIREQFHWATTMMARPSVLYRPDISLDGNMYCALYGRNLMEGCAGFGKTVADAMEDFDRNWHEQTVGGHAQVAAREGGE